MRNRAKCRLCSDIIESFHSSDYVSCKCGEIVVDGGDAYRCYAKDFNNFLRIDDEGNEIVVTVKPSRYELAAKDKPETTSLETRLSKKQLIDMLRSQIDNIEKLPPNAMTSPVTHYDLASSLMVVLSIFEADCADPN
jgi:hypothetical protein